MFLSSSNGREVARELERTLEKATGLRFDTDGLGKHTFSLYFLPFLSSVSSSLSLSTLLAPPRMAWPNRCC